MDNTRYDLIPPFGIKEISKVFTEKLIKYNKLKEQLKEKDA